MENLENQTSLKCHVLGLESHHIIHDKLTEKNLTKKLLFSTYHRKMAKLQKATTTPLLYFPSKEVYNLVLNRKDPLWRICRKSRSFLSAS